MPRDAVYIFRSTGKGDVELRYSLRGLAASGVGPRKVWVFGDRPEWLSGDTAVVEHVPHEYLARLGRWKTPLRNNFVMTFLASLIPDLTPEFFWFADDHILLRPLEGEPRRVGCAHHPGAPTGEVGEAHPMMSGSEVGEAHPTLSASDDLFRVRVLEDLATLPTRGRGLWQDALWRTADTLARLGYPTLNFEAHVPRASTKKLIWEAFCEFQDFVTEDRHFGVVAYTSIYNYGLKHGHLRREDLVWLRDEGRYVGFYKKQPTPEEVRQHCEGKTFLNFDDAAFGPALESFLAERFPEQCQYERDRTGLSVANA
jgi:hypothetical protein